MGASAHPGQKGREKNAHQLQTALAHANRAEHEERGFKACRWPDHKYDCQYGEGEAYQHGNTDKDLRNIELRYFRCNRVGAG